MKHCPQCSTGYPDTLAACPTHGLPLNEIRDFKPGMVVHHSYRIVRKLGQGGMGAVYLAQHTLMDEPRALKFLSSELSQDQAFTARFLREVRTLRQIRHPNVVDCGDLESAEDGSLFFSMKFVDGPDLRALLMNCHPERVKMILKNTDSNEHNLIDFCCVGIVQGNCANFVNLAATGPLGTRSRGASPLLPRVNLGQYAMSVPAVHTANDK